MKLTETEGQPHDPSNRRGPAGSPRIADLVHATVGKLSVRGLEAARHMVAGVWPNDEYTAIVAEQGRQDRPPGTQDWR
jgi:hypothetical protein